MFTGLYKYFKKRKLLLAFLSLAIISISIFYALKIKPVENIAQMIPVDDELIRFNKASENIKLNDKIILNFHFADTTVNHADSLIKCADSLIAEIEKNKEHIKSIQAKVADNVINDVYKIFYENLPIFLNDSDFVQISSKLDSISIQQTLEADYKNLISPAGMVTKKFITKDPLSLTPIALKKLESLQFDENYEIYDSHILTKNHKNLLVFINSKYSANNISNNKKLAEQIKNAVKKSLKNNPNIKVDVFGAPVIAVGNSEQIKSDIILTVSIAMALLFIFLTFFFRRIEILFIIFIPAIFGSALAVGLIYFIQAQVSVISLGVGSILIGISIDYSLHIFTHFRSQADVNEVFKDITMPILISSFTSSSAFFSLLFVSSEALQDLGLFAGISVLAAAVFSLIALPHFLRKKKSENNISEKDKKRNFVDKIASYSFENNKVIVFSVVIITIVSLFFVNKTDFESDMDKMNYMNEDLKIAEKNLNSISSIALRSMYLVSTGKNLEEALKNNEKIANIVTQLKDSNIVKSFSSVNTILLSETLQKQRIKRWNDFWTSQKKLKLKEDLIIYGKKFGFKEKAFSQFYTMLDKDFQLIDTASQNSLTTLFAKDLVTENTDITTVVTLLKLKQEDKIKVYDALPQSENIVIVDKKYLTDKIVQILKKDFNLLVKISLVVVFLILLIYFGRIELTLITFLPMIISWLWTLGIMAIFGIKFTIFNIIISTFIFGLGIDYSIFIMQGLLQEYRYGSKNLSSFKASILLSAITTVTAIGVLIFAKHPALKSIAFLSIIGIMSVVFVAYTLQPILFKFLVRQQGVKRNLPLTFVDVFFALVVFISFLIGTILSFFVWIVIAILPVKKAKKKDIFHYWLMILSKIIVYIPVNTKKIVNNHHKENFKKPAMIIVNHQSHIDITLMLMLHPKILILTNDWVQKNIFYGKIVKFADFYPVSEGVEENIKKLKEKVEAGYSVLVFPEGTRSKTMKINRFHKGAFHIANKLNLDILPIIIQGAGHCITKGEPFLRGGQISVNILERIQASNFGENERSQAKNIRKFMQNEYQKIRNKYETPKYFRKKLIANYIYKTPVVEHYTRVKTALEDNYEMFDKMLTRDGVITDIGCGYGYLPYMLNFVSPERKITGIDYDCQKINTAQNNISKNDNLNFICGDALTVEFPKSDAFIINDVLHYMPKDKQKDLIVRCIENLNEGGKIIIRDGNSEMQSRHKGTKLTEFFSTKVFKFNKTEFEKLHFTSKSEILEILKDYDFSVKIIDNTKRTSNIVFVIE